MKAQLSYSFTLWRHNVTSCDFFAYVVLIKYVWRYDAAMMIFVWQSVTVFLNPVYSERMR